MLKSTSFTFGTLLAVYLAGIGLGAAAGAAVAGRIRRPALGFFALQAGAGAYAALSLAAFIALLGHSRWSQWFVAYFGGYRCDRRPGGRDTDPERPARGSPGCSRCSRCGVGLRPVVRPVAGRLDRSAHVHGGLQLSALAAGGPHRSGASWPSRRRPARGEHPRQHVGRVRDRVAPARCTGNERDAQAGVRVERGLRCAGDSRGHHRFTSGRASRRVRRRCAGRGRHCRGDARRAAPLGPSARHDAAERDRRRRWLRAVGAQSGTSRLRSRRRVRQRPRPELDSLRQRAHRARGASGVCAPESAQRGADRPRIGRHVVCHGGTSGARARYVDRNHRASAHHLAPTLADHRVSWRHRNSQRPAHRARLGRRTSVLEAGRPQVRHHRSRRASSDQRLLRQSLLGRLFPAAAGPPQPGRPGGDLGADGPRGPHLRHRLSVRLAQSGRS